jgi:mannose-6-phosphate isomerase-like protein (cupin superfamily)
MDKEQQMAKQKQKYCKSLDNPDEKRTFRSHGFLDIVSLSDDFVIGKGVFEPGWKWSNDVKPLAETSSCQAEHHGYCISGTMVIRMDNGDQFEIRAGDAFTIPPGHDAWVIGEEACEMVDVSGFQNYARKAAA